MEEKGEEKGEEGGGGEKHTESLFLFHSRSFDCQEPPCSLPWQPQWSCDHARNAKGETHV